MKIPSSDTSSQENSSELRLPKILLLEGKDEELLIGKLLKQMNIADVQCIDIEGKPQFPPTIRALRRRTGFEKIVMVVSS